MGAVLVTMEGVFSKCGSGDGKALSGKIDYFLGLETNKTKQTNPLLHHHQSAKLCR